MDTSGGKSNWLVETYNCKVVILVYCGIFTVVVYTAEKEKKIDGDRQQMTQVSFKPKNITITLNVPD